MEAEPRYRDAADRLTRVRRMPVARRRRGDRALLRSDGRAAGRAEVESVQRVGELLLERRGELALLVPRVKPRHRVLPEPHGQRPQHRCHPAQEQRRAEPPQPPARRRRGGAQRRSPGPRRRGHLVPNGEAARTGSLAAGGWRLASAVMAQTLQRTPLFERHVAAGARMVPFAGWEMPVQYEGVISEHRAVRTDCGVFDVSHMGELDVEGPRAHEFLQSVLSNDLDRIEPGGAQYTLLTNDRGGIIDDLIAYRLGACHYLLVVNAGNHAAAYEWLKEREIR